MITTPAVNLGSQFNTFPDYQKTGVGIGDHRSKLVWFNPDLSFYRGSSGAVKGVGDETFHGKNHYTRGIQLQEIFPNKDLVNSVNNATVTFDINYYPRERGHYNYNVNPLDIDPTTGYFSKPENNWAGITRNISFDTDFENANIAHVGDLVFNRRFPFIDVPGGASIDQWIETLEKIVKYYDKDTIFICGHANEKYPVQINASDIKAMQNYLDKLRVYIKQQVKDGLTEEAVIAKTTIIPGAEEWTGDGVVRSIKAGFAEYKTM